MQAISRRFPAPRILALAVLSAWTCQAQAQQALDSTVVVTGQRSSIRKAILQQEGADNIVSVVSSDDIGALPDINASEAAARLPGISVQRDQGEGRYVTVRGLGPDLNAVTINGALVPAPENGRRGVSLDVLPAGMVRSLEVTKTLTPDMDANSLGGTVEVKTLSAFDVKNPLLNISLGDGYNTLAKKHSPQAGLLWADRFGAGQFGIAIGASVDRRKLASDDVETGGGWSKGRFTHAEIMLPLAVALGLPGKSEPLPQRVMFSERSSRWRAGEVSPYTANLQWDSYRHPDGRRIVRMLWNEDETDFKPACDGARIAPRSHFYDVGD